MRTAKRIAALLLAIVLAAGLAACVADSGSSPSGTYFAVRLVKGGVETDAEELSQISITFEPDGTGVLRVNAANEPFTWSGSTMTPRGGGNSIEFRFDGETLVLERDDALIEFQ